ncbi:MAG: hypothetical protein KIT36_20110, partial [Alphaproteobacteria bacterium]|nr:hypothetical protein [Alphaproteobacteria bacterium]
MAWTLAGSLLGLAVPAVGQERLDAGSPRSVRVDGQPERFVMCDRPNGPPTLGVMLGRRVVAVQRALDGETVTLDWRHCEPPLSARPSVQCRVAGSAIAVHIDVRLTDRVRRAGRGTFGERWEYHALRLRRLRGEDAVSWVDDEVELPADELFEDRIVRDAGRIDASGPDACGMGFLVIRSHVLHGASLALYALSPSDGLDSLAVSEPLGGPQRWRDVIGIADVVGDGRPRIVEIADPHLVGRLQIDRIGDGRIEPVSVLDGYTSHRFGTPRQGIGALLDFTGD